MEEVKMIKSLYTEITNQTQIYFQGRKLYEEKNFDYPAHYVHGADAAADTGICGQSLLRHLW